MQIIGRKRAGKADLWRIWREFEVAHFANLLHDDDHVVRAIIAVGHWKQDSAVASVAALQCCSSITPISKNVKGEIYIYIYNIYYIYKYKTILGAKK